MTRWGRRRWWTVVAVVTAVGVLAGGYAFARERRTAPTAPAWPVVAGDPYVIALGRDGCPIIEQRRFVDAPGQLVPPDATEVLLCTTPTVTLPPNSGVVHPPRQRVLRADAADFAALLNRLPDRNEVWRQWQRRHSGWFPDSPPEIPIGEACAAFGRPYDFSFVLRYRDRPPVPLVLACSDGLTSGTRTRMDHAKPSVVDVFVQRFAAQ